LKRGHLAAGVVSVGMRLVEEQPDSRCRDIEFHAL
jgi:hypothetical protein